MGQRGGCGDRVAGVLLVRAGGAMDPNITPLSSISK